MKAQVTLTVAESKRLIARGVAALDIVQAHMKQGMVAVCTGSTNACLLEDLLGQQFDKRTYITGKILPAGAPGSWPSEKRPDAVFRNGLLAPELDRYSAVKLMQPGDVFIKGANAINYERGLAGIWVAGEGSGTIGHTLGYVVTRGLFLLIPVGLEKCVPYPIERAARFVNEADETAGTVVSLFPVFGHIFTEIQALETLSAVEAVPCGAGGIAGAEGSVSLLIRGERANVLHAMDVIASLRGERGLSLDR